MPRIIICIEVPLKTDNQGLVIRPRVNDMPYLFSQANEGLERWVYLLETSEIDFVLLGIFLSISQGYII